MNRKRTQYGSHAPGTGAWRALGASLSVHATLVGAGLVWGILAASGEPRRARVYTAQFAPPSAAVAPEEQEPLELTPLPKSAHEPELRESEVWSDPEPLFALDEPVPEYELPGPRRVVDWFPERPLALGEFAPRPVPAAAAAADTDAVADAAAAPAVASPAPTPAPVVADAVPLATPRPGYPRLSRRAGEEGSVLCRLHVGADGRVRTVEVVESSGHERLDRAAAETLAAWQFEPRREDGRAVDARVLHRVTFRLREG
jgi:protein TonB